ncbi:MAG: phosphoglucosamine mutase [Planctomycetaceae bacterium]|jgi:phosphomannomutase|nr:phosphoglucosamine mutase [Planctomycetaceae bacterium]
MSLIISVSGLRGVVGRTLTPETAQNYARAFSEQSPDGLFVITRDSRSSGLMLAEAVHTALNHAGRSTIDAGIAATPTLGILIRRLNAAGGIQISASHNPSEYNGMKLFTHEGRVIPKIPGEKVLQCYHRRKTAPSADSTGSRGTKTLCDDPVSAHLEAVLATVNAEAVRERKFHVLLDSNRGAGGVLGRPLLEKLGCKVTVLGETPDGQFEHPPEPVETNLQPVFAKVRECQADIGFCQDPDADRLAVIDAAGRFLGEEYTVAMCTDHLLRTRGRGAVVTNCSSSRMTEEITQKHGGTFFRSPVGEANVVDQMIARNAVFGGEGNGGPIDPQVGFVRDSFVGMAQILDAMTARNLSAAALADELPRYVIVKRKFDLPHEKAAEAFAALQRFYRNFPIDTMDGCRIDKPDAWLLVRMSNTEPTARIIAEAPTDAGANRFCDEAEDVLNGVV